MWRSEALCSTTLSRMSAKSKFMPPGASASRWSLLSRAWALPGSGDARDLGDRRQPAADLLQAVLAQAHHALVHGGVHDRLRGLARDGERTDRVTDPHHLVEPDPALVARAATAGTADGFVRLEVEADVEAVGAHDLARDRRALLALLAQQSRETLGDDAVHGGADEERLDAHLDQAGDGARGVVGVQRREDQVAGEGGLDGDLRHLQVADFANQDDVGRLAQHRTQDLGECQSDRVAYLALVDAREVVLDGVLGGDDLAVGAVELVEGAVERRGLARAGRAGDQEDAVGALDDLLERLVVILLKAQ